jgi:hypothetical protein
MPADGAVELGGASRSHGKKHNTASIDPSAHVSLSLSLTLRFWGRRLDPDGDLCGSTSNTFLFHRSQWVLCAASASTGDLPGWWRYSETGRRSRLLVGLTLLCFFFLGGHIVCSPGLPPGCKGTLVGLGEFYVEKEADAGRIPAYWTEPDREGKFVARHVLYASALYVHWSKLY